jgi:hypothetical protein
MRIYGSRNVGQKGAEGTAAVAVSPLTPEDVGAAPRPLHDGPQADEVRRVALGIGPGTHVDVGEHSGRCERGDVSLHQPLRYPHPETVPEIRLAFTPAPTVGEQGAGFG